MKKMILSVFTLAVMLSLSLRVVSAHVVVKPNSAGIGSFQTFTMGVPVEKEIPTTAVRLLIPEGLAYVTPNVKPGWTIDIKKNGVGEAAVVTQIEWKGGTIPTGQRDEFSFSAKVPSSKTELHWKAYQTYADGTVVSWDGTSESTPYSVTNVIDDLSVTPAPTVTTQPEKSSNLSTIAIVLSVIAIAIAAKKTKAN